MDDVSQISQSKDIRPAVVRFGACQVQLKPLIFALRLLFIISIIANAQRDAANSVTVKF